MDPSQARWCTLRGCASLWWPQPELQPGSRTSARNPGPARLPWAGVEEEGAQGGSEGVESDARVGSELGDSEVDWLTVMGCGVPEGTPDSAVVELSWDVAISSVPGGLGCGVDASPGLEELASGGKVAGVAEMLADSVCGEEASGKKEKNSVVLGNCGSDPAV